MQNVNNNENQEVLKERSKKSRLITILGGLGGIIVLVVIAILIFKTPDKVYFVTDNGSTIKAATIDKEGHIVPPKDPTKYGWDFAGWYNGENFQKEISDLASYKFEKENFQDGKYIIYAKWSLHKYTITYELNEGVNNEKNPDFYTIKHELSSDPLDMGLTNEQTLSKYQPIYNPTKSGLTFQGWYFDEAGTRSLPMNNGVYYIDRVNLMSDTGDITIYAIWG